MTRSVAKEAPAAPKLGERVRWEKQSRRYDPSTLPRQGVVVFEGQPGAPLEEGNWLGEEDKSRVVVSGKGVRFSAHHGIVLRIDRRHPITDLPLLPWYYAPRPEDLKSAP